MEVLGRKYERKGGLVDGTKSLLPRWLVEGSVWGLPPSQTPRIWLLIVYEQPLRC